MNFNTFKSRRKTILLVIASFLIIIVFTKYFFLYQNKYSPTAKERWKNVENSYKINIGDSYEQVLKIMEKKPDDSHLDSFLVNKIIDSFWIRPAGPEQYIDIFYNPPHNAESGIRITFDTNFVVSDLGYYKDEYWNYPIEPE